VYKEMDLAGSEWLELRPDSERNRAKRQKVEERTNDLIDESRRLEKKIHAAEKRLR
jgi:C4-dicarboxylate-specific signal transduction histidine kinase